MFTLKSETQIYPIKMNQLRSFLDLEILILMLKNMYVYLQN